MPKFTVSVPCTAWSHFTVEAEDSEHAKQLVRNHKGTFEEYSYGEDDWNENHWETFNHEN